MGSDWEGNESFECLRNLCEVTYLPRTAGISTTKIKKDLGLADPKKTKSTASDKQKESAASPSTSRGRHFLRFATFFKPLF